MQHAKIIHAQHPALPLHCLHAMHNNTKTPKYLNLSQGVHFREKNKTKK